MLAVQIVPLLLGILIGLLIGLTAWGFRRCWGQDMGVALMGTHDGMLLGLFVLAIFTLGVFVSYALLR